jgi:hypothetical protein
MNVFPRIRNTRAKGVVPVSLSEIFKSILFAHS